MKVWQIIVVMVAIGIALGIVIHPLWVRIPACLMAGWVMAHATDAYNRFNSD